MIRNEGYDDIRKVTVTLRQSVNAFSGPSPSKPVNKPVEANFQVFFSNGSALISKFEINHLKGSRHGCSTQEGFTAFCKVVPSIMNNLDKYLYLIPVNDPVSNDL